MIIFFSSAETKGLISRADGITDLSVVHPSIRQLLLLIATPPSVLIRSF